MSGVAGYDFGLARFISNATSTITSDDSVSVPEHPTVTRIVTAIDSDNNTLSCSLTGGADAALFATNFNSRRLSFRSPRDFDYAADADHNNVFLVTVQVSDGTNLATQNGQVTANNVDDPLPITPDIVMKSVTANGKNLLTDVGSCDWLLAQRTTLIRRRLQQSLSRESQRVIFTRVP